MSEPYCLAMVLCDAVHRDPVTHKCTILGTCNSFAADKFPTVLQFFVYAAITDAIGPVKLTMRLVTSEYSLRNNDESGLVLEVESNEFDLESPLNILESYLRVKAKIDRPGQYHCELLANGQLLMARRLLVFDLESAEE